MRRVLLAVTIVIAILASVPAAVSAEVKVINPSERVIGVSAAEEGSRSGISYTPCPWQKVWQPSLWNRIKNFFKQVAASAGLIAIPPPQHAELILDPDAEETNVFFDGELALVLGRGTEYQVEYEGENVGLLSKFVMRFLGSPPLGVRQFNDSTTDDPDKPRYLNDEDYPEIQRGIDNETGDELWWDPYFISPEDATPSCRAGMIYSPRTTRAASLIPDLQDFMYTLLNPVLPVLEPVDNVEGWAYVQVPLNFAVDPTSLESVTAHAEVPNIAANSITWIEATAVPTRIHFDPGTGEALTYCEIEEVQEAYDPTVPGPCSYTYLDSSNVVPGGVYTATVAIEWKGVYDSSSGTGEFVIAPTYQQVEVSVAEARPAVAIAG
jgi:hypothetical protein